MFSLSVGVFMSFIYAAVHKKDYRLLQNIEGNSECGQLEMFDVTSIAEVGRCLFVSSSEATSGTRLQKMQCWCAN